MNWNWDNFAVTCDPARLDVAMIAGFLATTSGPGKKPEIFMERHDPDVYRRRPGGSRSMKELG